MDLRSLETPSLLLDRAVMRRNIQRMVDHVGSLGGVLRPHVKTHKSADVHAELVAAGGTRGVTVSTLAEARYFFEQGERDILYAVGITPNKLEPVADLMRRGADLKIILDSETMAALVCARGVELGLCFDVLIELDVDDHRAGVDPASPELLEIARALDGQGARLRGVMTHAGGSYDCSSVEAIRSVAARERDLSVAASNRLREAGYAVEIVSIGSTPTVSFVDHLEGITEVRAGVYVFHDLVQAGLGVCRREDIAISVLGSIIGHQSSKGWTLTDAGWMAVSRDRGTASQEEDFGYGQVLDLNAEPVGNLVLSAANQEHGIITAGPGNVVPHEVPAIGELVRILPNHACATAAQFDHYVVVEDGVVVGRWPRIRGW